MLTRMTTPVCCSFLLSPTWPSVATFATLLKISRKSKSVVTGGSLNVDCIERLSVDCCGSLNELQARSDVRRNLANIKL